jgi:hypothetical protein
LNDAVIVRLIAWKRLAEPDETAGLWLRLESHHEAPMTAAPKPVRSDVGHLAPYPETPLHRPS